MRQDKHEIYLELIQLLQVKVPLEHRDRDVGVEFGDTWQGHLVAAFPNVFLVQKVLRGQITDGNGFRIVNRDRLDTGEDDVLGCDSERRARTPTKSETSAF